jgi:phage terminase small subunit
MPKLDNKKHEAFCREYISSNFNGTAAYRTIYKGNRSAHVCASKLLATPKVRQRVEEMQAEYWRAQQMTADEVLARIAQVARFDPAKLADADGNPLPLHKVDPGTRGAISGVDFEERVVRDADGSEEAVLVSRVKKVRTSDRNKALEMLARGFSLFEREQETAAQAQASAFAGILKGLVVDRSGLGLVIDPPPKALPAKSGE